MADKSAWVTFRDSVVDSLKFDKVTDTMKEEFVKWLVEVLLPLAKTAADDFVAQIKAQATSETGWCKIRDMIVLPFIIEGGLWLIEKVLNKTIDVDKA
jgi:hypothetical protein